MDFFLYRGRDPKDFFSEPLVAVAAGFAVWGGASAALHPLEVIKIRCQQETVYGSLKPAASSFLGSVRALVKERALFTGLRVGFVGACFERLWIPLVYEKMKIIRSSNSTTCLGLYCQGTSRNSLNFYESTRWVEIFKVTSAAAPIIGLVESVKTTILTQLVVQNLARKVNTAHVPRHTVRQTVQWLRSNQWQRGLIPSAMAGTLKWIVLLYTYELYLVDYTAAPHGASRNEIVAAGALAGFLSTLVSHPLDTGLVLTASNPYPWYSSTAPPTMWSAVGQVSERSPRFLYRGVGPALVRNTLLFGATFPLYDYLRFQLGGTYMAPF
ncbi:hypothetical protein DIPPA_16942 [Diplonema papillatum]|nr:hypothetical protein DIPPA_16942 [Diplonema papillatum]